MISFSSFAQVDKEQTVIDEDSFVIPDSFSPYGDNENATWDILFKEYHEVELTVFSRWGKEVFKSEKLEIHWDGKSNKGKYLAPGEYFYMINLDDGVRSIKGNVTILK